MPLFSRRVPYDRKCILKRGEILARGWRWRRGLALYRQILAAEPLNADLHIRVAPLLARSGRLLEAWESYQIATDAMSQAGDAASAYALQQEAVRALPENVEACRALARAERVRQRPRDAMRVLLAGSKRLTRGGRRGGAIVLLRDARELDAWRPAVVVRLCRLLARDGQSAEALFLLDHLDQKVSGKTLCSVRRLTWRIEPSLRHSWRWMRAAWDARGQTSESADQLSPATPSRS